MSADAIIGIIGIFIGWFLSLLSAPLLNFFNNENKRGKVILGLASELSDLRNRMIMANPALALKTDQFNEKYEEWFLKNIKTCSKSESYKSLGMGNIFDDYINGKKTLESMFIKPGTTTAILSDKLYPRLSIPFLDSNMINISLLTNKQQTKLFSIHRHISFYNESIKRIDEYQILSLELTTEKNVNVCQDQISKLIKFIFSQQKQIIKEINDYLCTPSLFL